jgi:hypothetical protein
MSVTPFQSTEQTSEHLSPVAAKMILAALPEHIQRGLLGYSSETGYPIELVLEMAQVSWIANVLTLQTVNLSTLKALEVAV